MDKEQIKKEWQAGDNTAAANLINERFSQDEIQVTKWSCRSWLLQASNSSPLSKVYLWAFTKAIENRKAETNE